MSTSPNNSYDAIERVIFQTGIRIASLDFEPEQDKFTVVLTSDKALQFRISAFRLLAEASLEQLMKYELVANGLAVHWPELDEDLSLKGFLEEELKLAIGGETRFAMAA